MNTNYKQTKYVIAREAAEYPAQAETFTVVYEVRENISHHESIAEARAAIKRYEAADRRRAAPGSVECPHCHWGFAPSVIGQHMLEKHGSNHCGNDRVQL